MDWPCKHDQSNVGAYCSPPDSGMYDPSTPFISNKRGSVFDWKKGSPIGGKELSFVFTILRINVFFCIQRNRLVVERHDH